MSGIDAVFAALADPTRRTIMGVVARQGGASASALARHLPISRQGVAKHLLVLEEAGLLSRLRHGREVRYRTRTEPIDEAMAYLAGVAAEWDDRLAALAALTAEDDDE